MVSLRSVRFLVSLGNDMVYIDYRGKFRIMVYG